MGVTIYLWQSTSPSVANCKPTAPRIDEWQSTSPSVANCKSISLCNMLQLCIEISDSCFIPQPLAFAWLPVHRLYGPTRPWNARRRHGWL